ncbi:MAG: HD domain-containing protein, partial [Clostridiales Family XIII bacterium]|jgi:tRNA nucleotidyltransferase/poly(A) polymerase|nr:HD domain-containing protein [Clostridiales Family XIII bacterium]
MRLKEDALRILRALRFSAVLSFNIEDQLAKSIHNNKGLLCNISSERIAAEMSKMLIGDNILKVLLQYADVFAVFIPEIETSIGFEQRTPYHIYDVWEHTARSVAAVSMSSPTKDASQTIASSTSTTQSPIAVSSTSPTAISPPSPTTSPSTVPSSKPSPSPSSKLTTPTTSLSTPPTSSTANLYLRLTMLFHDLGKPRVFTMDEYGIGHFYQHNIDSEEIARKRLKALRFDNETIDVVTKLVRWHDTPISEKSLPRWLNRLGEENLRLLFEVKRADARAQNLLFSEARIATVDILEQQLNQLMENKQCFKLSDLEISGVDILQLGIKPGPAVGQVLNKLLEKVMDGEVANDRETLLVLAKKDIIYREHQYVDMI